jgi:hypothetical protein
LSSACKVQSKARICCNPYLCTKQLNQPHDGPRHLLLSPRQTQLGVVLGHELATRWPRQHRACNLQTTPRDLSGQRGAVSNDVWCTIPGENSDVHSIPLESTTVLSTSACLLGSASGAPFFQLLS